MSQEVLIIHFQIIISLSITSLKAFSEYSGNFDISSIGRLHREQRDAAIN